MNPYLSTYPQPGYGDGSHVPYPPLVPPPNQFYAPPRATQQYNGYPTAHYQSQYRRPSDPGPQMREPPQSLSRRQKSSRKSEDEVPRISRPTRPRNISMRTGIAPDYMFISLSSHDVLKIANMTSPMLGESLRDNLLRFWPQGVVSQSEHDNEWTARLGGDVWSAGGRHGIMARRFVCRLFTLLAEEGFGYLATVDSHPLKAPRMVFTSVPSDPQPYYFMISFSLNRRTLTIIDAPEKLAVLLGAALRGPDPLPPPAPNATENVRWTEPGVYEVITGDRGTGRQDLAVLMGAALKMIAAEGFRFEASVPLGKAGLFGLRGRREVWMFRSVSAPKPRVPKSDLRRRRI